MLPIESFPLFPVILHPTLGNILTEVLWKQYHNMVLPVAFWVPFLFAFDCFAHPSPKGKATGGFRCDK